MYLRMVYLECVTVLADILKFYNLIIITNQVSDRLTMGLFSAKSEIFNDVYENSKTLPFASSESSICQSLVSAFS